MSRAMALNSRLAILVGSIIFLLWRYQRSNFLTRLDHRLLIIHWMYPPSPTQILALAYAFVKISSE